MGEVSNNSQSAIYRQFYTRDVARRVISYNGSQNAVVQCVYRQYTEILSLLYISFFSLAVVAGSPLFFSLQSFYFGNKCGFFFCFGRGDREFLYLLVTCKGWDGSRDHLYLRPLGEGKV